MPIEKGALAIQFSGGVNLRQDAKQVPATQLIDLHNAVFTRQTSISKRNGYQGLSTQIQAAGGDITNARGLATRDDEVLLFTDKRAYSMRPSSGQWADTGEVAATTVTTLPIARTGTDQQQPDIATNNGITVVAWEDSRSGVWCSIVEDATGRILQSQITLDANANAQSPRCIRVEDVLHVLWVRSDLNSIMIAVINPATPTAAPVVSVLVSDLGPPFVFDAESARNAAKVDVGPPLHSIGRPGAIAWSRSGGGWRAGFISSSGVLGSPLTRLPNVMTFADTIVGAIAIATNWMPTALVTVGWVAAGQVIQATVLAAGDLSPVARFSQLGSGSTTYGRLTLCFGATVPGQPNNVQLYWAAEQTSTRTDLCAIESGWIDLNLTFNPLTSTVLRGHNLVSRAWYVDPLLTPHPTPVGDVYVAIAHTVRFFPYVAVLRLSGDHGIAAPTTTIVARLMPSEATGLNMHITSPTTKSWSLALPSAMGVNQVESNYLTRQIAVPLPYRVQLSSINGDQFSDQGIKLATLSYDAPYQTAQLGRGLYLASAAPQHYDGASWHEADFNTAPDLGYDASGVPVSISTVASLIGGLDGVDVGAHVYAIWYEAIDAQGEIHRGAVSIKFLVTVTGTLPQKVQLVLPTCRLTKFGNARICVARSIAGAIGTDSTLPLYRVTSNDVLAVTGDNRYVNNDPTVDFVTFVDAMSDTTLPTMEPLYTNGGILSNAPASWAGGVIASAKGRLFWTDSTNPNLVRYSQQIADDTALEAPLDLSIAVDPFGGGITAIGVMDDAVYPFKETSTFVFGGPGPGPDPSVNSEALSFSPAELVTSDVGCISPGSICQAPVGIAFQSRKGIKILSRDRQIVDIGNPVQPLDGQTYVRSTLLPDRKAILFLTSTPGGYSLYWDYDRVQWSKFSNHVGLDAVVVGLGGADGGIGAGIGGGVYHYLRGDSRVFRETPGAYKDDNSRIPMLIETAWIHLAQQLQGWQRILYAYFLGTYISSHTLSVRFRIDYNSGYSPAILSDVDSNYNPSRYGAGAYGAGAYGGPGLDGARYQRSIHINRRCQAVSFRIEDIESPDQFGAGFELSELMVIGGGLGPDFKVGAARSR